MSYIPEMSAYIVTTDNQTSASGDAFALSSMLHLGMVRVNHARLKERLMVAEIANAPTTMCI